MTPFASQNPAAPGHEDRVRRQIAVLTGAPDAGKTTVCTCLADEARNRGMRVSGLITEARRLTSGRIVQTALNLRTGERRRLADYVGVEEGEPIGRGLAGRLSWRFVGDSVRWGRHELDRCLVNPTDVLIVDQVGPLELLAGSGWVNAVRVLEEGRFALAVVAVNQLVIAQLRRRLGAAPMDEIDVGGSSTKELCARLLRLAQSGRTAAGA